MAGRRPAADTRYRTAYQAGARGAQMPEGLAAEATRDPALDHMHDAGRRGADYTASLREHAPHAVTRRPPPSSPTPRNPSPPARPSRWLSRPTSSTEAGAGVLLGMVVYALALSVVKYGANGPVLWFKAKFLNETPTKPKTSSVTT